MNKFLRNFLILLAIFLIVAGIFTFFNNNNNSTSPVSISTVAGEVRNSQVDKIEVSGDTLTVHLKDGTTQTSQKESEAALSETLKNYNVDPAKIQAVTIEVADNSASSFWTNSILPFAIPFIFIAGFIWLMMRQIQGTNNRAMSFGQSSAKVAEQTDRRKRITFGDVAG